MAVNILLRRGVASEWTASNPVLLEGEVGVETDTKKLKVGDGLTVWASLPYITLTPTAAASIYATIANPSFTGTVTLDTGVSLVFEGATANAFETTLTVADPTADRTLTLPDSTGTVATQEHVSNEIGTHSSDTTSVHGIADTADLATKTYADTAVSTHSSDTTNVHGITDTAELATKTYADTAAANAVSTSLGTHEVDTLSVHGIADTSLLVTTTGTQTLTNKTITTPAGLVKSDVGLGNVDNTSDANKPVSTATQTALDLKAPKADPTFTGTVSGVTKAHVGLGNVDNTSDVNKPVSTATQTALDAKASLAGATFTGSVEIDQNLVVDGNLTVNGTTFNASSTSIVIEDNMVQLAHQNAANTVDLGLVVAYNDGTAKHAGIVRDVSDAKWKLFKDVATEPTTTVAFGEGSLDTLAVGSLEATTVTPSSGVVFSDGTQTKEGVPSRTPIIQKTASYTLSALTERDSLIEVASSSGTTITIPLNSAVAFPVGTSVDILQTSTGQVTIAGDAGVTANATPGLKLRTQWSSATLFKRAENTWVVFGDLTA